MSHDSTVSSTHSSRDRGIGSRDGDEPSIVDGGHGDRSNASRARSECVEQETRIAAGRRQRQKRQGTRGQSEKRQRRRGQEEVDEERAPRTRAASTGVGADEYTVDGYASRSQ